MRLRLCILVAFETPAIKVLPKLFVTKKAKQVSFLLSNRDDVDGDVDDGDDDGSDDFDDAAEDDNVSILRRHNCFSKKIQNQLLTNPTDRSIPPSSRDFLKTDPV